MNTNKKKRLSYIYVLTTKDEHFYYVGQRHVPKNLKSADQDKYYLGSGKYITNYKKKHGTDGIIKQILIEGKFKQEELNKLEIKYIKKYRKKFGKLCKNFSDGGFGGCGPHSEEWKKNSSKRQKGHIVSEETKRKISKSHKGKKHNPWWNNGKKETARLTCPGKGWKKGRLKRKWYHSPDNKKATLASPNKKPKGWIPGHLPASEETRKKMSENRKGRQKTVKGYHIYNNGKIQTMAKKCPKGFKSGMLKKNKNKITSTKDKMLINNGTEEKFIFKNKEIPKGWIKGSLSKNKKKGPNKKLKNRKWINNGKENKRIKKNQPIPKGWHIGQLYHNFKASYSTLGRITITNGIKNRFIKPEEPIPDGWKRGMVQNHKKRKKRSKK